MGKLTVKINEKSITINFNKGDTIYDVLAANQIHITTPCGGKGTCGKCVVNVDGAERLACKTMAEDGMVIKVKDAGSSKILTQGIEFNVSTYEEGHGIAFDIGTTTIVGYLYDLKNAKLIKTISQMNKQRIYGADVLSRTADSKKMNQIIINQLNSMISSFSCPIKKIVIVGNTIMMHFVMGLDASSIAVAPFTPVTTSHHRFNGLQLGLDYDCPVDIMPCISGYVGADIVAGILASDLYRQNACSSLISALTVKSF